MPLVAALLLVSACDPAGSGDGAGSRSADTAVPTLRTTDVALPAGDEPVVVTPWAADLLVGSRAPEGSASRPRLTVLDAGGRSRQVEVTPVSPTAFQARWLVAAPRGGAVDLVGGAPAGAHSNTRWSTWRGDSTAVRELPQPFATFGGWGAGALVALVQTPGAPVIVGSWESSGAGLDIALWHPKGERWVRAPSAGTSLASTSTALVSARGATAAGDGLLVVGSVTLLGNGVRQRAAVWWSPTPDAKFSRTELPADGSLAEAHAASCNGAGRCAVVGVVDGLLRGWWVGAHGAVSDMDLPPLAVGEHDLLTAPLLGAGGATVLLASGGRLVVLDVAGDRVTRRDGPPARLVRSAARTASGTFVVLEEPAGTARLVRLDAP